MSETALAMIRSAVPSDTEALLSLALASSLFSPEELGQLSGMLATFHQAKTLSGESWLVDEDPGQGLVAVAYFAPERMTQGTWNLYFIAVHPDHQRNGRGSRLLADVERRLRQADQRILLVETMGIPDFEYVRAFYRSSGYREEARITGFYQENQDKIVYWKDLSTQDSSKA